MLAHWGFGKEQKVVYKKGSGWIVKTRVSEIIKKRVNYATILINYPFMFILIYGI